MNVIRLFPSQIPIFWESIKFAVAKAEGLEEIQYTPYFNQLLYALLSGKSQCFVRVKDELLHTVCITKVNIDNVRGEKALYIVCLYSFKLSGLDIWRDSLDFVKQFAIKEGCKMILATSAIQRVWELCNTLGFEEESRTFSMKL